VANFSLSQTGANGTLTYQVNGHKYKAKVRVRQASYVYGVVSDESHARQFRAFYPHRRALGQFSITVDCIGYNEFKRFMTWLRNYTDELLTQGVVSKATAIPLEVNVPIRNFHKFGILVTGIDDHDHVGSMVFSPQLTFVTLADANDPKISILHSDQVSRFKAPGVDPESTLAFYPVSAAKYKDTSLYDGSDTDINSVVNGTVDTNGGTGGQVKGE
jgi:hypothetical protein